MPTQTYTPTATWHNTSQYQENGDVSDAVVLQQMGKDALDNLTALTGSNSRSQIAQLWTVVDLAALKAVGTSSRRDQDYAVLDSNKRMYQFDSGSSATGDDYSVVVPTTGTGRWILQAGAVPKSTTKTWSLAGSSFFGLFSSTDLPTFTYSSGQVSSNANDSSVVQGTFSGFNVGDVLSSAKVLCTSSSTPSSTTVTVYAVSPGDTGNTVTALGTATLTQPLSSVTTITFGSAYTVLEGDTIYVEVAFGGGTGTWTLKNVRLLGTRSYITE